MSLLTTALVIYMSLAVQAPDTLKQCQICEREPFPSNHTFSHFYIFGDSHEDVGNSFALAGSAGSRWPTYLYDTCGRSCDGKLLVDFMAHGFGLPSPTASLPCQCGTDFATGGVTVLNLTYFKEISVPVLSPLTFQDELAWFKDQQRRCPGAELDKAVFIIGGGENDYTNQAVAGLTPLEIRASVDPLVNKIVQMVEEFIENGARNVLVESMRRLHCTPLFLINYDHKNFKDPEGLDELGCLKGFGKLFQFHNSRMVQALARIPGRNHINLNIQVIDRFKHHGDVLRDPLKYGFLYTNSACCGAGGKYNTEIPCGSPNATLCSNPNDHVYYDFAHFTESFNRQAARVFLFDKKYIIQIHQTSDELLSKAK